jgi:hypothetical protein
VGGKRLHHPQTPVCTPGDFCGRLRTQSSLGWATGGRTSPARLSLSSNGPGGALWPVNAYSDADELSTLLEAALGSGIVARRRARAHIYVYPLSISEPEPLVAVDPGAGPTLLGGALKLRHREDEDPIAFTLRLLAETVAEANALAARLEFIARERGC